MEKTLAILMADLSGYTALTEMHGAESAADLIEKYLSIAADCLVGDTIMHQRTGDEIMFIADSPDCLLSTAIKLATNTLKEENFLQMHGALHYGTVFERSGHFFGSAINLVARIAANAEAGTFCCSEEFVNAVTDKSVCSFKSKGNYLFKNINGEKQVFELNIKNDKTSYIDPVCRMLILNPRNAIQHPGESGLYFCSSQCLQLYNNKYSSVSNV